MSSMNGSFQYWYVLCSADADGVVLKICVLRWPFAIR